MENKDSKIPPEPATAGGFPNSSDTNEDDEDEPVTAAAAAVVDEDKEEEEEEAGKEDPSISNNRTKTLTEKRDLERRERVRLNVKAALNKGAQRRKHGQIHKGRESRAAPATPPIPSESPIPAAASPPPRSSVYEPGIRALISSVGSEDRWQGMRATWDRTAAKRAGRGARLGIRDGLSETGGSGARRMSRVSGGFTGGWVCVAACRARVVS